MGIGLGLAAVGRAPAGTAPRWSRWPWALLCAGVLLVAAAAVGASLALGLVLGACAAAVAALAPGAVARPAPAPATPPDALLRGARPPRPRRRSWRSA
ncbi:MAG: hypothetical protein M9894_37395 [Planctomycetes bacterium]|nr:hypothetical protein [Planctomycetota bacterium]